MTILFPVVVVLISTGLKFLVVVTRFGVMMVTMRSILFLIIVMLMRLKVLLSGTVVWMKALVMGPGVQMISQPLQVIILITGCR